MIVDLYLKKIAQQALLEMLKDGVIPSSVALSQLISEIIEGKDLSRPLISQDKPTVEFGEQASASKFNDIFSRIWDDLDVLYDTALVTEQELALSSARTEAELSRIDKDVRSLIDRADRLLLVADQTEGLLQVVGDNFQDSTNINLEETTAFIDTTSHTVHGNYFITESIDLDSEMDLSKITDADISITPLDTSLRRNPGTHDSRPTDMLKDSGHPWLYKLDSIEPLASAGIEIVIDFRRAIIPPADVVTISKIAFDPFLRNNSLLITVQYSIDGISWRDIPVVDPVRKLANSTTYLFESVSLNFLKLILVKDIYDESHNSYVYKYGIRHLGLYGVRDIFVEESTLISNPLMPTNPDGTPIQFTKVSLSKACEHIEPSTNIDYSIAFLIPGEDYEQTDFFPITPLNREDVIGPQLLSVAGSAEVLATVSISEGDEEFPFRLDTTNRLLEDQEVDQNSIEIWRNIGFKDRLYSVVQPDGSGLEAGWHRDGPYYITYGLVDTLAGMIIDFGPSTIEIDGVDLSGRVSLSPGIHRFRVQEQNWHSLRGLSKVTAVEASIKRLQGIQAYCGAEGLAATLDDLTEVPNYTVIDPLYPFNHKLLIEGLDYAVSYQGAKPYKGVSRYAAYLLRQIPESQMGLFSQPTDYDIFSFTRITDEVNPRLMVKWSQYDSESPREKFVLITRTGDYAEGLVLKAIFKTTNPKRTASLDGYEIRVK